jgi:hypothetical protein
MGKACFICLIIVVAVLLEDVGPVKRTKEEDREDKELAEKVNTTLAEEEKKRQEEEDQVKRKKKEEDQGKNRTEDSRKRETQDEACVTPNVTCPIIEPCPPCHECPEVEHCPLCENCTEPERCGPCQECPPVKECGPCPEVRPCLPCEPCPMANGTGTTPLVCQCSEGMSLSTAVAVGTVAGFLVTGMATVIGLVIRYVPPIVSGFLFLSTIIIVWYLSSQYPEMARDLGGRAMATLREATIALGHRVMEAIQRHQDQVGVPVKPNLFF